MRNNKFVIAGFFFAVLFERERENVCVWTYFALPCHLLSFLNQPWTIRAEMRQRRQRRRVKWNVRMNSWEWKMWLQNVFLYEMLRNFWLTLWLLKGNGEKKTAISLIMNRKFATKNLQLSCIRRLFVFLRVTFAKCWFCIYDTAHRWWDCMFTSCTIVIR